MPIPCPMLQGWHKCKNLMQRGEEGIKAGLWRRDDLEKALVLWHELVIVIVVVEICVGVVLLLVHLRFGRPRRGEHRRPRALQESQLGRWGYLFRRWRPLARCNLRFGSWSGGWWAWWGGPQRRGGLPYQGRGGWRAEESRECVPRLLLHAAASRRLFGLLLLVRLGGRSRGLVIPEPAVVR